MADQHDDATRQFYYLAALSCWEFVPVFVLRGLGPIIAPSRISVPLLEGKEPPWATDITRDSTQPVLSG